MRVLHIANDFANSKVHANLCRELDAQGVEQVVYCPVRTQKEIGGNHFDGKHTEIHYSFCIKSWYKFVYHYKARQLYRDLKQHVDLSNVDLIHASTMFSDGALAYKAYKEFGIPYIVAVRDTDLNDFIRLLKHTYSYGRKILMHAQKVVFISAALQKNFEKTSFVRPMLDNVKSRFMLQPNGIDDYWLQHVYHGRCEGQKVLYLGSFVPRKNVPRIIDAIVALRQEEKFKDLQLTIVGGGLDEKNKVEKMIAAHPECIRFLGKIQDKHKLAEVMRCHSLFAMPSIYETFGLVYLEALSQNLPILYSKGQGIDGMFDETIGIGVHPKSVFEIKEGLRTLIAKAKDFSNETIDFSLFDWKNIADVYLHLYKNILRDCK